MNQHLTGVASSVSAHCNYEPFDTIGFAIEHGIRAIQLYLDQDLMSSPSKIDEIAQVTMNEGITVICHSPEAFNTKTVADQIIRGVNRLLCYQKERRLVVHFDQDVSFQAMFELSSTLNKKGITPLLENSYKPDQETLLLDCFTKFNALFSMAQNQNLTIVPVIDIPRLFVAEIIERYDSLLLTKILLNTLANHGIQPVLHLIDFTDYNQKRDSWCAVGKGVMPYTEIFSFLETIGIQPLLSILELEKKEHVIESFEWLANR